MSENLRFRFMLIFPFFVGPPATAFLVVYQSMIGLLLSPVVLASGMFLFDLVYGYEELTGWEEYLGNAIWAFIYALLASSVTFFSIAFLAIVDLAVNG